MKDLRLTFNEDPVVYDRVRPSYPEPLFDELWRFARLAAAPVICEAGAGTGKATASLLARGARVTAVEIGRELADFMRARFAGHSNLVVIDQPFETAELLASSFDVVFSATAWHWMDPASRVERAASLLRPGGVIAIVDTVQVESDTDGGYFAASQQIYRRYGDPEPPALDEPGIHLPPALAELRNSQQFGEPVLHRYRWDQTYPRADYQDLMRSYSNMRAMKLEDREALIGELGALIDSDYGGFVTRPLEITLTVARKAAIAGS
jgi:SAM-dependent methyltransferase